MLRGFYGRDMLVMLLLILMVKWGCGFFSLSLVMILVIILGVNFFDEIL